MRRLMVVCLSFVFAALLSLSSTTAQEILYDNPAWVKGYGAIWSVEPTPDNSRIILNTSTGLYLLNPDTPDVAPLPLKGHSDSIQSFTFSHDGSLMATTSLDGTTRLWRMPSGEAVWSVSTGDPCCNGHEPTAATFTANDSLLMVNVGTYSPAGNFTINVSSGKAQSLILNTFPYVAAVHGNDVLYMQRSLEELTVMRVHAEGDEFTYSTDASLANVVIPSSPNGDSFSLITDDYAAVITDQGILTAIKLQNGTSQAVTRNFPPFLMAAGNSVWGTRDNTLSALNLDTGKRADVPMQQILSMDNSPWVLYTDTNGSLSTLDLKTLKSTSTGTTPKTYRWSQGYLAYLEDTHIKVLNASTGQTLTLTEVVSDPNTAFLPVYIANNRIAVLYRNGDTYAGIWDLTTGRSVVSPFAIDQYTPPFDLPAHDQERFAIGVQQPSSGNTGVILADLKAGTIQFLATQSHASPRALLGSQLFLDDPRFTLLDLSTGTETRPVSDDIAVRELAFSPDSKQLATSNYDNTIRLWDANSGAQVGVIGLQDDAFRMVYGSGGIVTLSTDSQLQFLPIPANGTPPSAISGAGQLFDLAANGSTIVAGGEGNVQLFVLNTSGSITPKDTLIPNAAFSPLRQYNAVAINERYIAAAADAFADDGSVQNTVVDLWSATTNKYIKRLDSQTRGAPYAITFSADGNFMALTASGTTVVWNLKRSLDEPAYLTSTNYDSGGTFAGDILVTLQQSWLKNTLNLYTLNNGAYVGTLHRNLNSLGGGGGEGYRVPVAGSADGTHIAHLDPRGELVIWNVPDQVALVAEGINTRKSTIIAYCDDLGGVEFNPGHDQPANLTWSWFATEIPLVYDHMMNAEYDIQLDGTALPLWKAQRSTIHRDQSNDNHWTVYYSLDVGMLTPGEHTISYQLTWDKAISDGLADYGPDTSHPEDTGTCHFTVN